MSRIQAMKEFYLEKGGSIRRANQIFGKTLPPQPPQLSVPITNGESAQSSVSLQDFSAAARGTAMVENIKSQGNTRHQEIVEMANQIPAIEEKILQQLAENALSRGKGASSATYLNFKTPDLSDKNSFAQYFSVQYIEHGGSTSRAEEIFFAGRVVGMTRFIEKIIPQLFKRAMSDTTGASFKTLQSLKTLNADFFKHHVEEIFISTLPAQSQKHGFLSFFSQRQILKDEAQKFYQERFTGIEPVVEPVMAQLS